MIKEIKSKNNIVALKNDIEQKIQSSITYWNVEGQVIHVKVGSNEYKASDKELSAIENYIQDKFRKKGLNNTVVLCTHHLVNIDIVGKV